MTAENRRQSGDNQQQALRQERGDGHSENNPLGATPAG
jgi:hypothetical protein